MPIKHHFQSGRTDNGDAGAIQPSHWDADHDLTGFLALLDAVAPSPNVVLTLDGSARLQLLPFASFAPTNSPAFTGVPTAPTAPAGTNSTQIATMEALQTAIANLVATAPSTLNTLNEIAIALGNDPNFSATITTALGNRLRIDAAQGLSAGQQAQGRSNLGLPLIYNQSTGGTGNFGRTVIQASNNSFELLSGDGTSFILTARYADAAPTFKGNVVYHAGNMPVGTAANNLVQLDASGKMPAVDGSQLTNVTASIQAGAIMYFPSNVPPNGFVAANGALLSRTMYPALWAFAQASGNIVSEGAWNVGNFSTGDGSTTFRIPDLRGEFIRGWDNGRGVDSGRAIGSWQQDAFQSHKHATSTNTVAGSGTTAAPGVNSIESDNGTPTGTPVSDGSNGTPRVAAETRPRNAALLVCIKY